MHRYHHRQLESWLFSCSQSRQVLCQADGSCSGQTICSVYKYHRRQLPGCFSVHRAVKFSAKLMGRALARRVKCTIMYATETGKSERFASTLCEIFKHAFDAKVRVRFGRTRSVVVRVNRNRRIFVVIVRLHSAFSLSLLVLI